MTTTTEKILQSAELLLNIKTKIAGSSGDLRDRVVSALYERELEARAKRIVAALEELTAAEQALQKINKPDQATYDETGTVVTQYYSKERTDAIKAAKKTLESLRTGIELALSGDFSKIK